MQAEIRGDRQPYASLQTAQASRGAWILSTNPWKAKAMGCGHLDAGHSCRITIYARQTRADWRVCRFQPNRSNAAISFNYCFSANVPCVSSYLHTCGLQWSICPCNGMWMEGGGYLRKHASVSGSCASFQHHAPPHARKHLMCPITCCSTLC